MSYSLYRSVLALGLGLAIAATAAFSPSPATTATGTATDATATDTGADARLLAPAGYTLTNAWYPSHDGVKLHAAVYLPTDSQPGETHPVILSVTPYTSPNGGATGIGFLDSEIPVRFPELFAHPAFKAGRYAYVAADVRGFGGSGGCFQYYENDEYLDMDTHVEWAGTQSWSSGKVGLWGKSYDAAQEVLALGDPSEHLAAAVIQAPGLSGYTALWQNGVHYATGRYGTTSVYVADDVFPNASTGSATNTDYAYSQVDGADGRGDCVVDWHGMNLIGDRDSIYWEGKEPYLKVVEQGSDVPVLWHNGFFDANTKPVGLDVVRALTGDLEVIWGQWDHKRGNETQYVGRDDFLDQSFRFFEEHLIGRVPTVNDPKATIQSGGPLGTWRTEAAWPPADVDTWAMTLKAGSYDDLPQQAVGGPGSGDGVWSTTPVLPHQLHVAGELVLDADITTLAPGATAVVRVYDLDASGRGYLLSRTAYALMDGGTETVRVSLNPQDWIVPAGHRLGVYIAASEDDWYTPGVTGQPVTIGRAVLEVPFITTRRTTFLDGRLSNFSQPFPITVATAKLAAAEVAGAVPPAQAEPQP